MSLLFWSLAAMPPSHGPAAHVTRSPGIAIAPNPSSSIVSFRLEDGAGSPVHVTICDARGRLVREIKSGAAMGWDGRDESGRLCPAGVYLVKRSDAFAAARLVRVRS